MSSGVTQEWSGRLACSSLCVWDYSSIFTQCVIGEACIYKLTGREHGGTETAEKRGLVDDTRRELHLTHQRA